MANWDEWEPESALRAARRTGYLELSFTAADLALGDSAEHPSQAAGARWEAERAADGRHAVTMGRVLEGHFVAISFHGGPEFEYVLEEFREAFRLHFEAEPQAGADIGNGCHGPLACRYVAVEAARALIEIDARPRDPGLEAAFLVEMS